MFVERKGLVCRLSYERKEKFVCPAHVLGSEPQTAAYIHMQVSVWVTLSVPFLIVDDSSVIRNIHES